MPKLLIAISIFLAGVMSVQGQTSYVNPTVGGLPGAGPGANECTTVATVTACQDKGYVCKDGLCIPPQGQASQSCDQAQCQDGEGLCIPNPLTECNIQDLLGKIIDWLIAFSIIISVGMIVWAGMMYVTAAGNTDKVKEAQRLIIYTLIGLVIILSAKGISLVIQSFFK